MVDVVEAPESVNKLLEDADLNLRSVGPCATVLSCGAVVCANTVHLFEPLHSRTRPA